MTRARTLIEQAEQIRSQRYAAADLQKAHDELTNADRANADRNTMTPVAMRSLRLRMPT